MFQPPQRLCVETKVVIFAYSPVRACVETKIYTLKRLIIQAFFVLRMPKKC
nr:MAG TPA: hypothetical protein [Caudoviricetes sp.]